MGNICKATSHTLNTEVSDDSFDRRTIMSTKNRAIFNDIYKQEKIESTIKLQPQPVINQLPFISLDLIEPYQFIPQIKISRRTLSFVKEKSFKDDNRSRTASQKINSEDITTSKQPLKSSLKSSLKSLNSKQGSSQKSQKSVRWESELSVFVNLIHYQNQLI